VKTRQLQVCVVGAGPRGLSVLERICARERRSPSHRAVVVHVVDPAEPGAGSVWRRDQSRHLLMNTVASQITVHTDASVRIDGPIEPGPSLHEWARELAADPRGTERADDATLAEARDLGPDDYPTRAFYGHYLRAAFDRLVATAPGHVRVVTHRSRAVAMADTHGVPGGPQGLRLEDGTRLHDLDAVVLAQGHVPARLTAGQARVASLARIHHLTYLPPGNPADQDLSGIRPGETVLLRGLGLNFFDYQALFSYGRGGTFERRGPAGRQRLVYRPSGDEPHLVAGSRRGIPYHARGDNEKGPYGRYTPRLLTPAAITALRDRRSAGEPVNFQADLWPLISLEAESVYYETLLRARGGPDARGIAGRFAARFLAADPGEAGEAQRAALLDAYGVAEEARWDWERLSRPYAGREFTGREDFHGWLLDYLAADVRAAREGNVSGPVKAALDALRDLRNEIRQVVDHGGLDGASHRDDLEGWYTPLNAFLSIGPPARRIEEMTALIEAGVLEVLGPGMEVRMDAAAPEFVARSTTVAGPPVRASVLIEARLPEPDLRRTADPLLRHLLDTEQCAPYEIPAGWGGSYETGGLAVSERPYRLLDGRGRAHPRRFAYGVPTESVHWVTAAGIRPGVDSVTLGDSDAIAAAVLSLPPLTLVPPAARPFTTQADLGAGAELPGVIV
jgi:hypothetical protein